MRALRKGQSYHVSDGASRHRSSTRRGARIFIVDGAMGGEERLMQKPAIGILAGMGPGSTAPFIDLLITECREQYGARDDIDFPAMMIYSLPTPFYPGRPIDHAAMEGAVLDGLRHLERTGVDFIAIACNTAHIYHPRLAEGIDRPLLNMVELALDGVPVSARGVAVVAARPTIESGIYQNGILKRGLKSIDPHWQIEVDHLLTATRSAPSETVIRGLWDGLMAKAESAGADTVLIACMDLSGISAHIRADLRIFDAGRCLAHEIVSQWRIRRSTRLSAEV